MLELEKILNTARKETDAALKGYYLGRAKEIIFNELHKDGIYIYLKDYMQQYENHLRVGEGMAYNPYDDLETWGG